MSLHPNPTLTPLNEARARRAHLHDSLSLGVASHATGRAVHPRDVPRCSVLTQRQCRIRAGGAGRAHGRAGREQRRAIGTAETGLTAGAGLTAGRYEGGARSLQAGHAGARAVLDDRSVVGRRRPRRAAAGRIRPVARRLELLELCRFGAPETDDARGAATIGDVFDGDAVRVGRTGMIQRRDRLASGCPRRPSGPPCPSAPGFTARSARGSALTTGATSCAATTTSAPSGADAACAATACSAVTARARSTAGDNREDGYERENRRSLQIHRLSFASKVRTNRGTTRTHCSLARALSFLSCPALSSDRDAPVWSLSTHSTK